MISLIKIDFLLKNVPSNIINFMTLGSRGATMCARVYLYNRYISKRNIVINGLLASINWVEKDHCYIAARYWRSRHIRQRVYFPKRYSDFIENKGDVKK